MTECEKLATCAFFKEYESDENKKLVLGGFVKLYCKGDKQNECIRKKVSTMLGGPEKVPVNMMPDGHPLAGTNKEDWSKEVIDSVKA
jgi:hypothetical protein